MRFVPDEKHGFFTGQDLQNRGDLPWSPRGFELAANCATLRSMKNYAIEAIPCRRDNYAYLIVGTDGLWVVDPTDYPPVQAAIASHQKPLLGILATHHHHDHVGGISELCKTHAASNPWVAAHASDRGRVPEQSVFIDAPRGQYIDSGLKVAGLPVLAAHIPGHTMGAIAWKVGDELFTGDTLFSGGCGRLFEGSPADMFQSFETLLSCPPHTRLWFGHEYTRSNLEFAAAIQPEHPAYAAALAELRTPSCPSTVERELKINVFARAKTPEQFGELRSRKDKS